MDSAILARYRKGAAKPIPMFDMNMPVMDKTLFGDIGLELEMEGERLPAANEIQRPGIRSGAYWTNHQDGSLRGEATEYVLSAPCFEEEVQPLVEALWAAFVAKRTVLHNSNRCSTHCHINVQGLKVSDLVAIVALWACFEKQIIEKFGGESRTKNHFCLSLRESGENIARLAAFLRTGATPHGRDMRYAACNIVSIWSRGSVEFRCAPAADTPQVPILFGLFLKKFVEFTAANYHDPSRLGSELSERGAVDIFKAICDSHEALDAFYRIVVPQGEEYQFNRDGLEGFRISQPLCHVFPWYEWMPMIDKKVVDPFGAKARKKAPYQEDPHVGDYLARAEEMLRDADEAPQRAPRGGLRPLPLNEDRMRGMVDFLRNDAAAQVMRNVQEGAAPAPEPGLQAEPMQVENEIALDDFDN